MEKPIKVMRSPSGNLKCVVGPRFLYEVTLYKDYKDRSELIDNRFYSSSKPIEYKEIQICKMDNYLLSKCITLLEAPIDYLLTNGFKEWTNEKSRRKRKSDSN